MTELGAGPKVSGGGQIRSSRVRIALLAAAGSFSLGCIAKIDLGGVGGAGGEVCGQSVQCTSGLCLGGRCCSLASCGSDPTCQASACEADGACKFPTGSCGISECTPATNVLSASRCSGGSCVPDPPMPCPGGYVCLGVHACRTTCSPDADDCVTGYYCAGSTCTPQASPGQTCDTDSACQSGHCGTSGTGHCCIGACSTGDTQGCAATDCDTTGGCFYPPPGTSCGPAQACTGQTQTNPGTCDGRGTCHAAVPPTTPCDPFLCGAANACATQCIGSADCVSTAFCDRGGQAAGVCCPSYVYNTIQIDGTLGLDRPCCGAGPGPAACRTIARAVTLAGETGVAQSILSVVINADGGGDWSGEGYPIQLSYGVDLRAPDIHFRTGNTNTLFVVSHFTGDTSSGTVTIEGDRNLPVHVGIDSHDVVGGSDTGILVTGPMNLELVNARIVVSSPCGTPCPYAAVLVTAGATLTLGAETSALTTVSIGTPGPQWPGSNGILCQGSPTLHATVNDLPSLTGAPSLWVQNQRVGIAALDYCDMNLSANPRIGAGFVAGGVCPDHSMGVGIQASGAQVRLYKASVQCCLGDGITSTRSDFGGDGNQVRANTGAGLRCAGGTCRPTNSIFASNGVGVSAENDPATGAALVDLSGGNQVGCNHHSVGLPPGMNIINQASGSLDARNLAWAQWDSSAGHTQLWTCDATLQVCSCSGASTCPAGTLPLPDGVDAVVAGMAPGSIDDGQGSSAATCP